MADVHNIETLHHAITPVSLYGTTKAKSFHYGEWALLTEFLTSNAPEALLGVVRHDGQVDMAVTPMGGSSGFSGSWNWRYDNAAYPGCGPTSCLSFQVTTILMPGHLYHQWWKWRHDIMVAAVRQAQLDHEAECSYGKWEAHIGSYGTDVTVTYNRQREDGGPRFTYWVYKRSELGVTA